MSIFIGTSGWSYPKGEGTWNGYFYPAGRINELEYYSRFFKTVELNSSFYRPPDARIVRRWLDATPRDFVFTVKLWQKFTHPQMFESATGETAIISKEDVDLFESGIEPLARAGKLGAILVQFPPGFKNGVSQRTFLQAVLNKFNRYPLAVELRSRTWSDDKGTGDLLRRYNAAWVQIDEPKFEFSISADLPVTSDLAYFRFHGRNAADWWTGNNETRYRYLYSTDEITQLADKVKKAAGQSKRTFAFFNNHWKAWAPRNAVDMIKALDLPMPDTPQFSSGKLFE
jgi:uncharacterized protein YecE (DUF72 family)